MSNAKFQELLAAARAKAALSTVVLPAPAAVSPARSDETSSETSTNDNNTANNSFPASVNNAALVTLPNGKTIELTNEQLSFVEAVSTGRNAVLIGPAGTGKTTAQYAATLRLMQNCAPLSDSTKFLSAGAPGIVIISYTNRAVNNIRKNLTADLQRNCLTYHKLLEYEPNFEEVLDPVSGEAKTRRVFLPNRTPHNPLPASISTIIIEEASMFSKDYFATLMAACPHNPQVILLGDICQLPPIYDAAILGFWLCDSAIHVTELTKVHRQALESPILRLATEIRQGIEFPTAKLLADFGRPEDRTGLRLIPMQKRVAAQYVVEPISKGLCSMIDNGLFNVDTDIILMPHEKEVSVASGEKLCSTTNVNKYIATHLARQRQEPVHHIIAGFKQHYFAVGDKVFYAKEEGRIIKISRNGKYMGKQTEHASYYMDHFGTVNDPADAEKTVEALALEAEETAASTSVASADEILMFLDQMSKAAEKSDERVTQASHVIEVELITGVRCVLDKAAEINELLHGYALTVHKAQGCEWRHVVVVFHNSHQKMLQREMLYTAITRAREQLTIFFETEAPGKQGTFVQGVRSQRIKGNTLAEKAEYFKGKHINDAVTE